MRAGFAKGWEAPSHASILTAIVVSIVYSVLRWMSLSGIEPLLFPDSELYISLFRDGVPATPFTQKRSWGYPAFIWLMSHNHGAIVACQRLFGILAWLSLAWSALFALRTAISRLLTFFSILTLSLSFTVIQWDACILTESLTLSGIVVSLTLIIWIRLLQDKGAVLQLPLLGCLLFLVGLRDANAFILPVFAGTLLLGCLPEAVEAIRVKRLNRVLLLAPLVTAGLLLLTAVLHFHWATRANRSWMTTANAITIRAFLRVEPDQKTTNKDIVALFQERYGAPSSIAERAGLNIYESPVDRPLESWFEEKGPEAWKSFLLSNPRWVWSTYTDYPPPYAAPSEGYFQHHKENWGGSRPILAGHLEQLINRATLPVLSWWRFHLAFLIYALVIAVIWQGTVWQKTSRSISTCLESLVILAGISAVISLLSLVGDAIEDWRHALTGLLALYISIPLLLGTLVDWITVKVKEGR